MRVVIGLFASLRNILAGTVLYMFPHASINGIRIIFVDLDADRAACLQRLDAAIDKITCAPPGIRKALGHVRHIVIPPGGGASTDTLGGVQVGSEHVAELPMSLLASVLVHEATHLRIASYGVAASSNRRERIERVCIRQQSRFLRASGGDGEEVATALEEESDRQRWWTDEAREADLVRALEAQSVPPWLGALIRRSRALNR